MSDSLIPSFLVSDVSESLRSLTKNERCEWIAQFAHQKWATMGDSLRSFGYSLIFSQKTSDLLRKPMREFPALVFLYFFQFLETFETQPNTDLFRAVLYFAKLKKITKLSTLVSEDCRFGLCAAVLVNFGFSKIKFSDSAQCSSPQSPP